MNGLVNVVITKAHQSMVGRRQAEGPDHTFAELGSEGLTAWELTVPESSQMLQECYPIIGGGAVLACNPKV